MATWETFQPICLLCDTQERTGVANQDPAGRKGEKLDFSLFKLF